MQIEFDNMRDLLLQTWRAYDAFTIEKWDESQSLPTPLARSVAAQQYNDLAIIRDVIARKIKSRYLIDPNKWDADEHGEPYPQAGFHP